MDIAVTLTEAGVPSPSLLKWNRTPKAIQDARMEQNAKRKADGEVVKALPPSPYWDSSVLSDMIRSRTYLGEISYTPTDVDGRAERHDRRWFPSIYEPVIDLETFEAVQGMLAGRNGGKRRFSGPKQEVLLSGMLACSCGLGAMTKNSRHDQEDDFNYACNFNKKTRGKACGNPRKSGQAVHAAAFRLLEAGLKARLDAFLKNPPLPKSPDESLNKEIQSRLDEREMVKRFAFKGKITEAEADAEFDRLNAEIDMLKHRLVAESPADTTADELRNFIVNLGQSWAAIDFGTKREILSTYVPDGFILDHGILKAKVCGFPLATKIETMTRGGTPLKIEGFYTTTEAAQRLGVSPQYIGQMIDAGKLPVERRQTGKLMKKFVPCEAVDTLVEAKGKQ